MGDEGRGRTEEGKEKKEAEKREGKGREAGSGRKRRKPRRDCFSTLVQMNLCLTDRICPDQPSLYLAFEWGKGCFLSMAEQIYFYG